MTIQQQMKSKLEAIGLPFKEIEVYGSQIVITSACVDTANQWAAIVQKFAKLRGVIEARDETANNRDVNMPHMVKVWRTYAAI